MSIEDLYDDAARERVVVGLHCRQLGLVEVDHGPAVDDEPDRDVGERETSAFQEALPDVDVVDRKPNRQGVECLLPCTRVGPHRPVEHIRIEQV